MSGDPVPLHTTPLNPAQQEVLEQLGRAPDERPRFDPRLRHELKADLTDATEAVARHVSPDDPLFIAKHQLGLVHGCERRFCAEDDEPFAWSVPSARGTVTHKAIELAVNWRGEPVPGHLVDEAIESLSRDTSSIGDFLAGLGPAERAEMRAAAVEYVTKFLESFPPLRASWRPVTESRLRLELHEGRIIAQGKVDLTLGRPDGDRAGKVIIDLKAGGFSTAHREDLRFYALLETIRVGTPPRLLVTYYLDQGTLHAEEVTVEVLHAAVRRLADGAGLMVALRSGQRVPTTRPGPACRWCVALDDCDDGRRHLADTDEP
ncbi:MAG: hypothetical protein D6683_01340 [Actinomyces sp.]|nr:MAG: hypothetical protein D6683_01340 [Actinomyces sp.]